MKLSENEFRALETLVDKGGSMLVTDVPDRNVVEIRFREIVPGHTVYKKLEKAGLVFYTLEEPLDYSGDTLDGFMFTEEIYITDAGRSAFNGYTGN